MPRPSSEDIKNAPGAPSNSRASTAEWIFGLSRVNVKEEGGRTRLEIPGADAYSFGIDSEGFLLHDGKRRSMFASRKMPSSFTSARIYGLVCDLAAGAIHLYVDGTHLCACFGVGSTIYGHLDQLSQSKIIRQGRLIPTFGLKPSPMRSFESKAEMLYPAITLNFGSNTFAHRPMTAWDATRIHHLQFRKSFDPSRRFITKDLQRMKTVRRAS